jgi:prophage regulatory protein
MSPAENTHRRTDGIAREAERREITGIPSSSWYVLQAQGLAPKPVRLGPRSVGWLRSELWAFLEDRMAERDDRWQRLARRRGDARRRQVGAAMTTEVCDSQADALQSALALSPASPLATRHRR